MNEDGSVERPELGDGDPISAFLAEIDATAQSVDTGVTSAILDASTAADALEICEMQL